MSSNLKIRVPRTEKEHKSQLRIRELELKKVSFLLCEFSAFPLAENEGIRTVNSLTGRRQENLT